jgi:glycerol-3-phosphate dehydrogenase
MGRLVRMRLLVAGAGAVGGFLAARFLDGGHEVTVLVRPRRAAQIRKDGLKITSASGPRVLRPALITAEKVTAPYDAVVVAVKADALIEVMNHGRWMSLYGLPGKAVKYVFGNPQSRTPSCAAMCAPARRCRWRS